MKLNCRSGSAARNRLGLIRRAGHVVGKNPASRGFLVDQRRHVIFGDCSDGENTKFGSSSRQSYSKEIETFRDGIDLRAGWTRQTRYRRREGLS